MRSSSREPVRIGIVGAGRVVNRHHVKNISRLEGMEVTAVCDLDPRAVEALTAESTVAGYSDYTQMFESERLDAVLICTPPGVRLEPIRAAVERDMAVFVEKPPALNVEHAAEIGSIIERSGAVNAVGFMYRYSKCINELKGMIAGEPVSLVRSALLCGPALNPEHPAWFFNKEISGGPILDQAIHMLDVSRYLFGEVDALQAFGVNVVRPRSDEFTVEDSVSINLKYESGTAQNHIHSWAYSGVLIQLEVISDRLHLRLDLPGALRGRVGGKDIEFAPDADEFYLQEMAAFRDAVRHQDQGLVKSPYADSVRTLETALAANASAETGESVRFAAASTVELRA